MIYLIVAINLSITLLNIYIAIRIWQLGRLIARITAIVNKYECYFQFTLRNVPIVLSGSQSNLRQLRQKYQLLQLQITRIKQLIWLVSWSYRTWLKT